MVFGDYRSITDTQIGFCGGYEFAIYPITATWTTCGSLLLIYYHNEISPTYKDPRRCFAGGSPLKNSTGEIDSLPGDFSGIFGVWYRTITDSEVHYYWYGSYVLTLFLS